MMKYAKQCSQNKITTLTTIFSPTIVITVKFTNKLVSNIALIFFTSVIPNCTRQQCGLSFLVKTVILSN